MSDELERLRADLEVLERYQRDYDMLAGEAIIDIKNSIARLEAEAADPWREALKTVEKWRRLDDGAPLWDPERKTVALVDHLTDENAQLAARVAELEAALEPPFGPSDDQMEREIMSSAVNLMNELGTDPDDLNDTKSPKFETAATRTVKYTDEHGMPVPACGKVIVEQFGDEYHLLVDGEDGFQVVLTFCKTRYAAAFFAQAINWIIPCREIVRRLAELGTIGDRALMYRLWQDAARLWAKMQEEAKGGENGS